MKEDSSVHNTERHARNGAGSAQASVRRRPPGQKPEVPAVARAARLLELLAASGEPVSLAALTRALELPKSTVHGLCSTLVQTGLVTRFENGTYHLGLRIMDLAHAFLARTDLTGEFAKILERTAPLPEESIVLSVLDGADIVYVACRNGTRPFGFNFRIGMRLPANCTATGKALLASLPPERVADLAHQRAFYALTRNSITDLAPLQRQLAQVRRQGHASDDEETREGMVCIGAPVFGAASGEATAAVGISMPKSAFSEARRTIALRAVKALAAELSTRLGAPVPRSAAS